jgi:hypothetical protein
LSININDKKDKGKMSLYFLQIKQMIQNYTYDLKK